MALRLTAVLLLLASVMSAQPAPVEERFYQAIRADDLAALRALIRDEGVQATDALGQTPLMTAAAFGSPDAVRLLLAAGADAKIASNTGVTALHLAATDAAKTRMLLDAGADVKAVSQLGRTPLLVAASAYGTSEVVRQLLAKGADVNAGDSAGVTPIVAATNVNDADVVGMLLSHGADPTASAKAEGIATPLIGAARNGNVELVRMLLARKADVNATTIDRGPIVKNGPIQFGSVTALHLAAVSGNADVVKTLLESGARVDPLDVRGMTPLMFAIATDRAEPRVIRLLLEAGASPTVRSKANESAIDWARKFNHPAVLAALQLAPATFAAAHATAAGSVDTTQAANPLTARPSVERALPLLRSASGRMVTDGGCAVACHAQPLTGLAFNAARARGWTSASSDTESTAVLTQLTAAVPGLLQLRDGGGLPDALLYASLLLSAERRPPSRTTDAIAHYVAAKQRKEGSWRGIGGTRAPMQDGSFSRTALAIRALSAYGTPSRAGEYKERVNRAAAWLASQAPISTEDRVMQLLGLHWANADARLRQTRTRELQALQRPDGGWAQTPHLASDAYATGQALYTLREMGVPAGSAALQRGADYLRRTQQDDGSWHVVNRAMKVQPYFESGFPYAHDQWISHAGTAWAALGLTATAVDRPPATASR